MGFLSKVFKTSLDLATDPFNKKKIAAQQGALRSGVGTGVDIGKDPEVEARKAAAVVRQRQEQDALLTQQLNKAQAGLDLGLENTPDVVVGGTARALTERRKKRRGGTGTSIASSLGLGV
jgi:hypothetical protein